MITATWRAGFEQVFEHGGETTQTEAAKKRSEKIRQMEISRTEFAELVQMKEDSVFVDSMFNLIDKDRNGFLSFGEFLNMNILLSKGGL